MFECADVQKLLDFCNRDFVRYRHIIHDLNPPCPEWDKAMQRWDYAEGKFVLTANERSDNDSVEYFVDALKQISLLACIRGNDLRLEGEIRNISYAELVDWCKCLAPGKVETTHEVLKNCLSEALGIKQWGERGGEYTATMDSFKERITSRVRRLSADDRPIWQRFVERHADEPIVSPGKGGSGTGVRDFEFMCLGLPVDYYVTQEGEDITGFLSVNPFTDRCDEISSLFVDPEHRRKGLAHSLLSVATQDILARGRRPCYSAAGGPHRREDLFRMLIGIGYYLIPSPWQG